VFAHACNLGLEGIVSKRKDSPYRPGRTPDWLKSKNPASPAAKRDAEGFAGTVGKSLAVGCPMIAANQIMDLCGVYYPDRIG
jgi:hypothetical protein